jgi:hypothetical protein
MLEPTLFLFVTLGIFCIITNRDRLFVIALILSILTKETGIFLVPLYYSINSKKFWDKSTIKKAGTYLILAISILVIVRLTLHREPYSFLDYVFVVIKERYSMIVTSPGSLFLHLTVLPFGLVFVLSILDTLKMTRVFKDYWGLILPVYAQFFLAVGTARLVIYAFPAVLLMSLYGLESFTEDLSINNVQIGPSWFIPLFYIYILVGIMSNPGLFDSITYVLIQISAFVIYVAVILCVVKIDAFVKQASIFS